MTNKLTVLGLVAATAFIFTSCTKDNDTSLNNKLIAPVASLEAPTLNDGATLKGGNESEEANEGLSGPSVETAPVSAPALALKGGNESEEAIEDLPIPTPPIWNNADRYQKTEGVKGAYSNIPDPIAPNVIPQPWTVPVQVSNDAIRLYNMSTQNPNDPLPVEPNVIPPTWSNPVDVSDDATKLYNMSTQNPNDPLPVEPNVIPQTWSNPVDVSDDAARLYNMSTQNPNDPLPVEPQQIPHTYMDEAGVSNNTVRFVNGGGLPDCSFPVVGKENAGKLDL